MRSADEHFEVVKLIAAGLNDCEIARRTGIPRKTVWQWRRMPGVRPRSTTDSSGRCTVHDFATLPAKAYCYVLGMYLGDGCISRGARTWHLRITLDTKYPGIIDGCREAIEILMPGQRATIVSRKDNCVDVVLCSNHWPCLFPQHGPGRKHHRRIALESWQEAIVKEATEDFVRGLLHSDGCRVVADDRGVKSIRYHFTNHSEDILNLFTAALDWLGIPWTRSTKYVVSIYRKAATARLDEFIGPKV
ncbi:helix-turn-helix domain-containing protein [Mycolicibacterium fortuitum]|uniref:helix-turn-helix domain-containing protein n=1 Tax=Mycolicibacterium fortuitum TaxID=1766 RepID=UPI003AABA93F